MMRRALLPLVGLALLLGFAFPASAQYMQVTGIVITSRGIPVPGCAVQLLSTDLGPSIIVTTGGNGGFFFDAIPTNVRSLYTLQVRWGENVIYQGFVTRPGLQPNIIIPVP